MHKPLLFLPGPMQVPDQVRLAGDRPLFNHRLPQMSELLSKLEGGCKPLFGTTGDVIFTASSGTGAMESAVVNLTSPGDEIIVVEGGTFATMEVYARKPGNGITGVIPPNGFDLAALRRRLETDFGIQIAGGLGKLKDTIFRIGHMGHVTDEEVDYFVQTFARCLA